MTDAVVVMAFIGDLFPQQIETPAAVARGIAAHCPMDQYRNADKEIQDVIRAANDWRGAHPPRSAEADFVSAARRAYERFA